MLTVVQIVRIDSEDLLSFRKMVGAYWQEVQGSVHREAYFQSRFSLDGENDGLYWAAVGDHRIGFLMFRVYEDGAHAHIHDFYVIPEERRKGYGTAMVKWLLQYLDHLGVAQIDLHVRVDNPGAIEFWKAQGFDIFQYRFRRYREASGNKVASTASLW
jgi:ribosomal protein S18 acetylase RimI-like enzyme